MLGRTASFRPENLGQNAIRMIGNLCFALFVFVVLIFTIIAATYSPDDPLLNPSKKLDTFLTSRTNATFKSDDSVIRTGEDFLNSSSSASVPFFNASDLTTLQIKEEQLQESNTDSPQDMSSSECAYKQDDPIDCSLPEVFHAMMRYAIEKFKDIHFYKFGKPAPGSGNGRSCDMAWRFRPSNAKRAGFYKDYRRFELSRSENCTYEVTSVGEYHTGVNARKKKKFKGKKDKDFVPKNAGEETAKEEKIVVPEFGDAENDTLPVVESEGKFSSGKYLIYSGGGDRCKSMTHYLWSFLCALGEAQYLNRTFVMDLSMCLSGMYTGSNQDEEGKDFRFYFDFEHLRDSASVLDQREFWTDWGKWQKKDGLNLHLVEDFRVTPMKLRSVEDTVIMRKFGEVEPDNYWYRVCEGETESVIQRPWHLIWKSRRLMEIVSGIASKMNWDFDSVHIVRGEKAKNTEMWPNLAVDTSPDTLLSTLRDKVDYGRQLYIATNEPDTSFFDPLKDKYTTHFLDDFKELWDENSEWYAETMELNNKVPVEFDGYMRVEVDTEVFLRGKKQIETFNDLTNDCKDGIYPSKEVIHDLPGTSYVEVVCTGARATTFDFKNKCPYPVCVGTLSGGGSPPLPETSFQLEPSSSTSLPAPPSWSGRFWARTHCLVDPTGRFSCTTADCGSGQVPCNGAGAQPPATLIEITLGPSQDFYDISLVDGYNVPVSMEPVGGTGDCRAATCPTNVNTVCPKELSVVAGNLGMVACKSACDAFGNPEYCCTGPVYGNPANCKPTRYSEIFKTACPFAYSYAFDDATGTFTCSSPGSYAVIFCP